MNRLLAITRSTIPYVKELRPKLKSLSACILMQQLEYWFERFFNGFYKFLNPAPGHEKYKEGDSWLEELGFSNEEFGSAFNKIGVRWKSRSDFSKAQNKFVSPGGEELFYCSYFDRLKGITYYFRNHALVDQFLDSLVNSGNPTSPVSLPHQPKIHVNRHSRDTESDDPAIMNISDNTSETNCRNKRGAPSQSSLSNIDSKRFSNRTLTTHAELSYEPLWQALVETLKLDPHIAKTDRNLTATFKELKRLSATPDDVNRFFLWWSSHDWRGQKGDFPGYNDILLNWRRALEFQSNKAENVVPSQIKSSKGKSAQLEQNLNNVDMAFEFLNTGVKSW